MAFFVHDTVKRVYGSSSEAERATAEAILHKIRKQEIEDNFTARDIQRHGSSNLTSREEVHVGLGLLVEHDYLAVANAAIGEQGGRPKAVYMINPRVFP